MDENPFLRMLDKYVTDARSFFWDAIIALNVNGISGDYVEFGSWGAKSLSLAHEAISTTASKRHLWAFDSFQGLPTAADPRDEHPQWGSGGQGYEWIPGHKTPGSEGGVEAFHDMCEKAGVPRSAYTAVEGFFEDTLPPLGADGPPADIALAYIDCNMYSSTVTVLDFLAPRMKHGMIIGVDDYQCWSPTDVSGERTALHEFQLAHPEWRLRRYKDIHWAGVSFVVEHAHLLADG